MKPFSLPRKERIKGTTQPSLLFHHGSLYNETPFLCRFIFTPADCGGLQILFAVPKKRIKKAVDRNRLRRQMREAWRLNAGPLREKCINNSVLLQLGFYYQSNDILPYSIIEQKIKSLIERLIQHHEKTDC
ncbi:MAG: ribonuclease P protein component [Bacteroidales bacterium]|nr:ribonuclease P protein component [Bacteroidales bacterium]